ncbi:formate dehydrogenase accessory protein FdhE [Marinobacter daepoensis]|uniref:formate dehydrogenase accessory protein FdhE n=1 Tax=Marinobacter daepoensis TaxID=262077 RepID=UPI00040AA67A|nr:formate dehydrogenase accessory protein FdhE [Marinobacter daepoensis]
MSSKIIEPGQIEASATTPPFVLLPPKDVFARRAEGLASLAADHPLAAYLNLIARVSAAQDELLANPPELPDLDQPALVTALKHQMPPLAVDSLLQESHWQTVLDVWLTRFSKQNPDLPAPVTQALAQLQEASHQQRLDWAKDLTGGRFSDLPGAVVPFLGAALQLTWTLWLDQVPAQNIREQEDQTVCPCCGSLPVAGVIHQRQPADGARYLLCSLCATQWHYVRLKCSHCLGTRGLEYLHFDDSPYGIRAEACPECHTCLKQLYLEHAPNADAVAADLASLDLDMSLAEQGFHRRAPSLLLAPGGDGNHNREA